MTAAEGYLTQAMGHRRYLDMAVDLALSLREWDGTRPVAIVVDDTVRAAAPAELLGVFDAVVPLPSGYTAYRAGKFAVAEATPYARTLFVDADCVAVNRLDHLWTQMDPGGLTFTGELLPATEDRNHHGFHTADLLRTYGDELYLKTNSGVFAFAKEAGRTFFAECLDLHLHRLLPELTDGFVGDELAIGIVGGQQRLATFEAPVPMYWPEELAKLQPEGPFPKPVLHLIGHVPGRTWRWLVGQMNARRRAAGLPANAAAGWQTKRRRLREHRFREGVRRLLGGDRRGKA